MTTLTPQPVNEQYHTCAYCLGEYPAWEIALYDEDLVCRVCLYKTLKAGERQQLVDITLTWNPAPLASRFTAVVDHYRIEGLIMPMQPPKEN